MPARKCTECGESLRGRARQTKTCSDLCRSQRSRRLHSVKKRAAEAGELPPHQAEVAAIVRDEAPDIVHDLAEQELRPIVREAITEDVLRAIDKMVGLTERATDLIAQDLESDDPVIRQRAYNLVTKYTLGHPALVKPEQDKSQQPLVVQFALPRPGDPEEVVEHAEVVEVDPLKECVVCKQEKPESQFVAGSDRCDSCHEAVLKRAQDTLDSHASH